MKKSIKRFFELFSDKFWRAKQKYPQYFRTLPIDEGAILLESEHGKKLDGNIFYILRELACGEDYQGYRIYLSSLGRNMKRFRRILNGHGIHGVNIVMLASEEYFKLLASAKYLVNDTSFGPYFVKKEGQVYLNTWHGTPIKCLGRSDRAEPHRLGNIQRNFILSDYLLCPNEYTENILTQDYMLKNLASGKILLSGYPRNDIFFDKEARMRVRSELSLGDTRVYAYMPTYRGSLSASKKERHGVYLSYHLFEIDRALRGGEIMYVKLHPLARECVCFENFKRVRPFPERYELYELLNAVDLLISDYSSVVFDFALTGRKIILFSYDEREYTAERGVYVKPSDLPFAVVGSVGNLIREMRSESKPDTVEFIKEFCPYDSSSSAKNAVRALLFNEGRLRDFGSNGKENVLIFAGNLAKNGITASLLSLLSQLDLTKRNYFVAFRSEAVGGNLDAVRAIPEGVGYLAFSGDINLSLRERFIRLLFKKKIISAKLYIRLCKRAISDGLLQLAGGKKFDILIQFGGYESERILLFSLHSGKRIIFVHNDMAGEIKVKKNQRGDVLRFAYREYDRVAVVTEDLIEPTARISGRRDNITVVRNTLNTERILALSEEEIRRAHYAECSLSHRELTSLLDSDNKKFINVARFSPEKGQKRLVRAFCRYLEEEPNSLLFIIGGYSVGDYLFELKTEIEALGLKKRVIFIRKAKNPYAIIKKCDYFILSSFYEGFGLVLAEADILGLSVVSTDVIGPRNFMLKHGGTLVPNSEDGILEGLRMLGENRVKPLSIDYDEYNERAIGEFEELLGGE